MSVGSLGTNGSITSAKGGSRANSGGGGGGSNKAGVGDDASVASIKSGGSRK